MQGDGRTDESQDQVGKLEDRLLWSQGLPRMHLTDPHPRKLEHDEFIVAFANCWG